MNSVFTIQINDEDILHKLNEFADSDEERESVALLALRIGLEAMPVIRGQLDRQALQDVGIHMLDRIHDSLDVVLQTHQQTLLDQFSLDVEDSAMQRLQYQITESYQQIYKTIIESSTSRQYQRRSTQGGGVFEDDLGKVLQDIATGAGDTFEAVGNEIGKIDRSKVGDFVITLGDSCIAASECIVFEAKRDKSYNRSKALTECRTARANRGAQVGVFVWDRESAGGKLPPLHREGNDIIVLWDVDDEETDIYLKAAYWLARSLVLPKSEDEAERETQIHQVQDAFDKIQRQMEGLEKLKKSGEKIEKEGKSIATIAKDIYDTLEIQIERMGKIIEELTATPASG